MSGEVTTKIPRSTLQWAVSSITALLMSGLFAGPTAAQEPGVLEEIIVTAQKREESQQDVPISVATMSGERYNVLFSGSEDILALSGRVPGLYAESSNGRAAPRFYVRGLGNVDFDLAASQPVSIVMDEVVMENVVLKSFPLFDMQQVEVIRGPQGTLFGRNTTAGIIKFNTVRPSHETSGYVKGSLATHETTNFEGAVGGSLIEDTLSARVSVLKRDRANWVTNGFTGLESLGDYDEAAGRIQVDWTPNDQFSALLSYQRRNLEGTSALFRANVFDTGSNALNSNFNRELVNYDGGDDNPQGYISSGTTLNMQWDFGNVSATSITSWQDSEGSSRGDIDGGVASEVPFPSVSEDGADTDQFTQEFRIASDTDGAFSWQVGAFFFDSDLVVTTDSFASMGFVTSQDTIIQQENEAWAVFGQGSYDVTDRLTLTAGVRHTDDEKDFRVLQFSQLWLDLGIPTFLADPVNVSDNQLSWEVSANFAASDTSSLYARFADGFRAQTIQGRDVAFLGTPSVAIPETINSFEAGYKAELASGRMRLNLSAYWYEVDDMQLSIIGGMGNINRVINAEQGEATGFEIDAEFLVTENFLVTAGAGYNDTEIKDPTLATTPCGSGACTPTDPVNPAQPNEVLLDGNPFPNSPESTFNFTARWGAPIGTDAEIYFLTDWTWYGERNIFLYESVEFKTDTQFEGGLRVGYKNYENGWEVAAFGRNITDEENVLGAIDFNNNTGFVNEPQVWGVEVGYEFGD
ncbi:MAG: TonB-dependent receptor [Woeseiaceae bacterium]